VCLKTILLRAGCTFLFYNCLLAAADLWAGIFKLIIKLCIIVGENLVGAAVAIFLCSPECTRVSIAERLLPPRNY